MRVDSRLTLVLALTLAAYAVAATPGRVQPDPAAPCPQSGTKPHELCFEIPNDGIARAESSSDTFYAILLKTADRCTITEEERLQAQQLFPKAKVFSMRFSCDDDVEENLTYTNVNDKFGFLAVYAGPTMKEAKARLAEAKATGKFPGANIREMQAKRISP
jgi:hypothetical protein